MAIRISQEMKQTQNLLMTPQLQQAIKLLTLPHQEMTSVINQELVENPILEEVQSSTPNEKQDFEDDSSEPSQQHDSASDIQQFTTDSIEEWSSYFNDDNTEYTSCCTGDEGKDFNYENIISQGESLEEHLLWQIRMENLTQAEQKVVQFIIHNLTYEGRLTITPEEISLSMKHDLEDTQEILKMIQNLDPIGCATSSLQECLLVQAMTLTPRVPLVELIISKYLSFLENRNYESIAIQENVELSEIDYAISLITSFNPRPGKLISGERTHYISPDIYVRNVGGELLVNLNDEGLPTLRISKYYKSLIKKLHTAQTQETKNYIQEKFRSALWLIKSLHNRQKTILKVTEAIVRLQPDFFLKGPQFLRPMILKDIAHEIGVHESTVSRVTVNKYVHTPLGLYELKYFFNSGIGGKQGGIPMAVEPLKLKIKTLIGMESPKRPFSDQKIVEILEKEDIKIARRTVAKYREGLGIPPSSKRKVRKC